MPRNPQKPQVDELERTIAELEQRVARLTALHRVAQSMATTPTASRVLVELARELGAAIPRVCEVSVSEWDRRRGVIRDIFEFNPRLGRRVPLADLKFDLAVLPEVEALLRRGSGSLVSLSTGEGTSESQVAYMKRFSWRSLLQVPLASAGRTLGVIEIVDIETARPWDRHEIEFCETLATQAAITLQHAQLFERIRFMADHDALTALANPRVFHRKAAAAERAARRRETQVAVLVMDIDDFKRLNDDHGHAHGDRVLRRIASILRQQRARVGRGRPARRRRARAAPSPHDRRAGRRDRRAAGARVRARELRPLDRARGHAGHRGCGSQPRRGCGSSVAAREAARQAPDRARGLS